MSEQHSEFVCLEVNGKCLLKAGDGLERLAKNLDVNPLSSFLSGDPNEAFQLMEAPDEYFDEETGRYDRVAVEKWLGFTMPEETWFEPSAGLTTVRALLAHLQKDTHGIPYLEGVIQDLQDCERVLEGLHENGIRWHLAADF
ncbi:hypothetical protein [Armatimonas sp.]|uniref:hypothetical protein n=1 Tax=Armatimonas sp. TaxID=1872638 RepID=UPI0037518316